VTLLCYLAAALIKAKMQKKEKIKK
jgi:hypothetical protein